MSRRQTPAGFAPVMSDPADPEGRLYAPVAATGYGLLAALGIVVLAVALAILGLAAAGYSNSLAIKDRQEPTCTSIKQTSLYRDVVTQAVSGNNPSDAIMAVGNNYDSGRIITLTNAVVAIFNKTTRTRIALFPQTALLATNNGGDGYVTYDSFHDRFFMSFLLYSACAHVANVTSPAFPSFCSAVAQFGAVNFALSSGFVVASPLNGCGPLSNAGAVNGKIVLMIRGGCTFVTKGLNAQAAGAIGMIVYNTVPDVVNTMGGTDPTITIPCVSVNGNTGALLTATPSAIISLVSGGVPSFNNTPIVAVSKTSAPNGPGDFYTYQLVTPTSMGARTDYPKHSTNFDTFFLTGRDFVAIDPQGHTEILGGHIFALNKIDMMNGVGATLRYERYTGLTEIPMPAQIRMPTTQPNQPVWLWTTNVSVVINSDKIYIYRATAGGVNNLTPYVVTLPREISITNIGAYARQPSPIIPQGLIFINIPNNGVVYKDSMWVAFANNVSSVHTVISIMEFDLSNVWATNEVTLRQFIDLDPGIDLDVGYPSLDINEEGDVMINFAISGPNQYIATGFTGRLATDPLNTIRYPVQIWLPGNSTYLSQGQNQTNSNRWLDYTGAMFDPVDRETFYMFSNCPDPRVGVMPDGVTTQWVAAFGTATINADSSCRGVVKTHPQRVQIDFKKEARYARDHPSTFPPPEGSDEEDPADEGEDE